MDVQQSAGADRLGGTMFETLARSNGGPIEVGELAIKPDGEVYPRPGDQPVEFTFEYVGVTFEAHLPADRDAPLTLTARIGKLPYSAETPFGRRMVRTLLQHAQIPHGKLTLDFHGRVHLTMHGTPWRPRTPVHVMVIVAGLLVEAKPYLDLLQAADGR